MLVITAFALALFASAEQFLYDPQYIVRPSPEDVRDPLIHLGGNSPWFAGPNVNDVSNEVPEGCVVEKASYTLRHGSRYPDPGAYQGWLDLYYKIQNSTSFTATGPLAFLPTWSPVLTAPDLQIAQLSPTGIKEAHDLGYALRTRYPSLYTPGPNFPVWTNDYPRVIQTAQSFVRGYLGPLATSNASVIALNSTGDVSAFGNSLGPSDLCPAFQDSYANATDVWDAMYLPPITARLNTFLQGNLTLTDDDVSNFPYLCGFESQILGKLSPFCAVFTDEELEAYEYRQDLRYWYGTGPGSEVAKSMMRPYLAAVVELLQQEGDVEGLGLQGEKFVLPKLLMAFANDGQMNELVTALGVFDEQSALPADAIDEDRQYVASRFVSMRGTVALEKLRCTAPAALPTCFPSNATEPRNSAYIRILFNDAVYPVTKCQSGPGRSCPVEQYQGLLEEKYGEEGSFWRICNVTDEAFPEEVKGATFFTDLTLPFLRLVQP